MSSSASLIQRSSLAALVASFALAAPAMAQPTERASELALQSFSLVGSWNCAGTGGLQGFRFLTTFNFGGTFTVSFSDKVFSETHGVWERTGLRAFASTDQAFLYDANGVADRIQTVDATYDIKSATDLAITISGVVTSLADGAVLTAFPAVVNCKRMLIKDSHTKGER